MFCIAVDPTYTASVKGELAGSLPVDFKAVFQRFTVSGFEALRTEIREQGLSDEAVVQRVLVGWSDVVDANGVPLPFGPETLANLLSIVGMCQLLVETYFESVADARRKN